MTFIVPGRGGKLATRWPSGDDLGGVVDDTVLFCCVGVDMGADDTKADEPDTGTTVRPGSVFNLTEPKIIPPFSPGDDVCTLALCCPVADELGKDTIPVETSTCTGFSDFSLLRF